MGAPGQGMKAADQAAAETLLTAFKTLSAAERRRHASVLNYWLSVRGDKEFPPLHDLDPLELSDAGPSSILLELISGGHDAEIRHLGEALREGAWPERIIDAPNPSVLSCIAKKLPIVAISRDFLAFEDEYETADGKTRCSVTLLPLSAGGAWVDYVYALVSTDNGAAKTAKAVAKPEPESAETPEPEIAEQPGAVIEDETFVEAAAEEEVASQEPDPVAAEAQETAEAAEPYEDEPEPASKPAPGFSKLLDSIAGLTGFYGSQPVKVEPVIESRPVPVEEAVEELAPEEPAEIEEAADAEPV